jgi:hypothetical protein
MLKAPLPSVLIASLLLAGCASVPPERTEVAAASRTYPDGRYAVWQRILATSARNSMFIRQADSANGVLMVRREIVSPNAEIGDAILDWAECPRSGLVERTVSQRVEISYAVRQERDGTTTVTLNDRFGEHRRNPLQQEKWVSCTSTGVLERRLLDSLN